MSAGDNEYVVALSGAAVAMLYRVMVHGHTGGKPGVRDELVEAVSQAYASVKRHRAKQIRGSADGEETQGERARGSDADPSATQEHAG